jgi:hypothetical protein
VSSGDLTVITPTEYRADAVIVLTIDYAPVLAVVVEVQLSQDKTKRRTWPVYVTSVHARLGCLVLLLVVCPDRAMAEWSATRVVVGGPGIALAPLVLHPEAVPVVTDLTLARSNPELTVL